MGQLMRRFPDACLAFIALVYLLFVINVKFGKDRWKDIIAYDGKGYYAYLPALWIYHDLQFNFYPAIEAKYYTAAGYFDYREKVGDVRLNKFSVGTAVMMAPFFLAGDLFAHASGAAIDGWSFPYQAAISIAGIFYALLGLGLLRRIFTLSGVPDLPSGLILLSLAFGTHLFYYALNEPSMSHVYSFAAIAAWIYIGQQYARSPDRSRMFQLAFLLGLLIVIRPVNGMVLFSLPFIAGRNGWLNIMSSLKSRPWRFVSFGSIVLGWMLFQVLLNYAQSGSLILYTYGEQRLDLLHPHLFDFLLSYRKGLFIYTPWCLLAVLVSFVLFRDDPWRAISGIGFLVLVIWVLSSWSLWWYGGSFSSRPMVDYLPFFALLLGVAWSALRKNRIVRIGLPAVLFFVVFVNQVQTYQYRYKIIHWDSMDREHYFRVFLRVDQLGQKTNPNADLLENR